MSLENNWENKSIEILEKQNYGDPASAPTGLVKRCLEAVKLPIGDLTNEQLRTLISQKIGLAYLIPLALDKLEKDIITQGDLYAGDLLEAVVKADIEFWKSNFELYERSKILIQRWKQRIVQYDIDTSAFPNL